MMKNVVNAMLYIGAVSLLFGAASRIFLPDAYRYIYMSGALLFSVAQFIQRPRVKGVTLKRLVMQQQLAGLFFIAAGVLMFVCFRNEWMVILFCGALMELYTIFRISHELKKEGDIQ